MYVFKLKKLNKVEGKESYQVAALENSDTEVDINRAWETIRENIKISAKESLGYYKLKKHKPWFDEGCSKLFEERKHAKLHALTPDNCHISHLKNTAFRVLIVTSIY
jgi:hypothetical protein